MSTPIAESLLWPDHNIGKRESRKLREEHNRVVNSHWELLNALKLCLECAEERECEYGQENAVAIKLRALIVKAEGNQS